MRIVRSLLVLAVLALSASLVAFAQTDVHFPSDPQGAMQAARESVAGGDLPGAIKALALYVAAHPHEADPQRLLGDLYYRAGNLPMAEQTYRAILLYRPGDKETHNRLGAVYATENRIDDAIAEYERSLPGADSVPDLVRLHEIKGDLGTYEVERERLAFENPNDAEAQLELAKVYLATHRPELAVVYFRKALGDAPGSLLAMNGLGMAYMDERDYTDAITTFQSCRDEDLQNYPCTVNLGATYLEMNKLDDAGKILELAHRLQPEQPEALVNFGYLADSRDDWKGAIRYYLEALSVYPYSIDAYIDLGYEYESHKLYALAQQALVKGLSVDPRDGRLHFLLGETYADQGQDDLARAQFQLASQSDDPAIKRIALARVAALAALPHRP